MARVQPFAYHHLRKRDWERESSEQWRQMARTVPETLLRLATSGLKEVLWYVESTGRWLRGIKVADLLEMDPAQAIRGASLEASIRGISRLRGLHAAAGHVFVLCAALLGLQQRERWQGWVDRSGDPDQLADEALRRLRSALADLTAGAHVVRVVSRRPPESPPRVAWTSEANRLLRHAADEVARARDAVWRMRHAVVLEFFDAWAVLTAAERRTC